MADTQKLISLLRAINPSDYNVVREFLEYYLPTYYNEKIKRVNTDTGYYQVLYANPYIKHGIEYTGDYHAFYNLGTLERKIIHSDPRITEIYDKKGTMIERKIKYKDYNIEETYSERTLIKQKYNYSTGFSRLNKYFNGYQYFEMVTTNKYIFIAKVETVNNISINYINSHLYDRVTRFPLIECKKIIAKDIYELSLATTSVKSFIKQISVSDDMEFTCDHLKCIFKTDIRNEFSYDIMTYMFNNSNII